MARCLSGNRRLTSLRESRRIFNCCKALGLGEIVDSVGVEERIQRFGRPSDGRNPVAPGPAFYLTEAFDDQSLPQLLAQRDVPQPDNRMRSPLGGRDRELNAFNGHGLAQTRDQISGQKGTVSRSADNPLRVGPVGSGPIEPSEDSGERSWIMLHSVGDDRQTKRCKAKRIVIGVEKQALALRLQPRNDAGQNRAARDQAQRLVAAAHSPRQPTREHHAWDTGSFSRHGRRVRAWRRNKRAVAWIAIDGPQTSAHVLPMTIAKLDLSGLKCPLPALKTRKALNALAPGDWLEVRCTDPLAAIDVPHLVREIGDRLKAIERGEHDIVFRIERSAPTVAPKPAPR